MGHPRPPPASSPTSFRPVAAAVLARVTALVLLLSIIPATAAASAAAPAAGRSPAPPTRSAFSKTGRGNAIPGCTTAACDLYNGDWVFDPDHYPLYNASQCPFADKEFNCQRNGRPDSEYLSYRWQPRGCDLRRPNASEFLEQWRGKRVMFVGDSLSLNQWTSFVCFLHSAAPKAAIAAGHAPKAVVFPDYGLTVSYYHSLYLVDMELQPGLGTALRLDTIDDGAARWWAANDLLIFNTWHWWPRRGKDQPWDYILIGNKTYADMDRVEAFSRGLSTWSRWVEANIDPGVTTVFFQGISPTHYHGSDWGQINATTCYGQTRPVDQERYPQPVDAWPHVQAVRAAVAAIRSPPVGLLDVTLLSQLRKDGHPSKFGFFPMDCSHWCVAGVPDTWNQLLIASLAGQLSS